MSKYLISTCETYRVGTESEAKQLIEDSKKAKEYSLTKYVSEYKNRKAKGEIVDEFYKVTLTKTFNDIKEPDSTVAVSYNKADGFFPDPIERNGDLNDDESEEAIF